MVLLLLAIALAASIGGVDGGVDAADEQPVAMTPAECDELLDDTIAEQGRLRSTGERDPQAHHFGAGGVAGSSAAVIADADRDRKEGHRAAMQLVLDAYTRLQGSGGCAHRSAFTTHANAAMAWRAFAELTKPVADAAALDHAVLQAEAALKIARSGPETPVRAQREVAILTELGVALKLGFWRRREAVARFTEVLTATNGRDDFALLQLCDVLSSLGQSREAIEVCGEYVHGQARASLTDPVDRATALHKVAVSLTADGQLDRAVVTNKEGRAMVTELRMSRAGGSGGGPRLQLAKLWSDMVALFHYLKLVTGQRAGRLKKPRGRDPAWETVPGPGAPGWCPPPVELAASAVVHSVARGAGLVDHIDAKSITPRAFHKEYVETNRPALLHWSDGDTTGSAPRATWAAFEAWGRDQLVAAHGADLQVHVSSLPYANMYDIVQATATLEDFVRDHMPDSCGGGDATTGNPANIAGNQSSVAQREQPRRPTPYIFEKILDAGSPLRSDFEIPAYFASKALKKVPDFFELLVGANGTGALAHTHQAAWNVVIAGMKRWFMWPPDMHLNTTLPMGTHVTTWLSDEYAAQVEQGFGPMEFVQLPGEAVFVPEGWWHAVLNVGDTVAVSKQMGAVSALGKKARARSKRSEL